LPSTTTWIYQDLNGWARPNSNLSGAQSVNATVPTSPQYQYSIFFVGNDYRFYQMTSDWNNDWTSSGVPIHSTAMSANNCYISSYNWTSVFFVSITGNIIHKLAYFNNVWNEQIPIAGLGPCGDCKAIYAQDDSDCYFTNADFNIEQISYNNSTSTWINYHVQYLAGSNAKILNLAMITGGGGQNLICYNYDLSDIIQLNVAGTWHYQSLFVAAGIENCTLLNMAIEVGTNALGNIANGNILQMVQQTATNSGSQNLNYQIQIDTAQSCTITNQYTNTLSLSFSESATVGVKDVCSFTDTDTQTYTFSFSNTNAQTFSKNLTQNFTVVVPPGKTSTAVYTTYQIQYNVPYIATFQNNTSLQIFTIAGTFQVQDGFSRASFTVTEAVNA